MFLHCAHRNAEYGSNVLVILFLNAAHEKDRPRPFREIQQSRLDDAKRFPTLDDAASIEISAAVQFAIERHVFVRAAHGTASMAVCDDTCGSLKDITTNVFDFTALAPGDADEHVLTESRCWAGVPENRDVLA